MERRERVGERDGGECVVELSRMVLVHCYDAGKHIHTL